MTPMFAMLNGWEVVAILAVVLIIFGAKKLPELARGLGQGIKEFKKYSRELQDEITSAIDLDSPPPPPRRVTPPVENTTPRSEPSAAAQTESVPQSSEPAAAPQPSEPKG
jgi:sec-independent protein translocase protein TatA